MVQLATESQNATTVIFLSKSFCHINFSISKKNLKLRLRQKICGYALIAGALSKILPTIKVSIAPQKNISQQFVRNRLLEKAQGGKNQRNHLR